MWQQGSNLDDLSQVSFDVVRGSRLQDIWTFRQSGDWIPEREGKEDSIQNHIQGLG